jgi:hypothetical protein
MCLASGRRNFLRSHVSGVLLGCLAARGSWWAKGARKSNGRRPGRALRQWSRQPFPVSSTDFIIANKKRKYESKPFYSLKKVSTISPVMFAVRKTAAFENGGQNRKGKDHFDRVSQAVPYRRGPPGVRV